MRTLSDMFVAAKLAGWRADDGYHFRSNESAAMQAVAVVIDWLEKEADAFLAEHVNESGFAPADIEYQAQALSERAQRLAEVPF